MQEQTDPMILAIWESLPPSMRIGAWEHLSPKAKELITKEQIQHRDILAGKRSIYA